MPTPDRSRRVRFGVCALFALAAAIVSGCGGYNLYPANPEEPLAFTDPNSPPMRPATQAALRYAVERWPARDARFNPVPFTVNFPVGMRRVACEEIIRSLGPDARLLTPENASLPTFHVRSIWIRGDEGKVEVLRPLGDLDPASDSSGAVCQGVTMHVRGGLTGWRVIAHTSHVIGAVRPPALYFAPDYPESEARAAARRAHERQASESPGPADGEREPMRTPPEDVSESFDSAPDDAGQRSGEDSGEMRPVPQNPPAQPPAQPEPAPPEPQPDDGGEHVLPLRGGGGGSGGGAPR